ncbi:MAG TPA: neutral zinc metallopeptidase [Pseudonocardiaceae bacterium]
MDAAWAPVLDAARLPRKLPHVNIDTNLGETGCGDVSEGGNADFVGLYCGTIDTMYLPLDRTLAIDGGEPATHVALLAHEYAHHVQEESGLLGTVQRDMEQAGQAAPVVEDLGRRLELQANCFAGLFIGAAAGHGSFSHGLAEGSMTLFRYGESSPTHGSAVNQHLWAQRGFQRRTTAACDTFAAPAGEVA